MRADKARRRGVPNDGIGGGSIKVFFSPINRVSAKKVSNGSQINGSFIDRQCVYIYRERSSRFVDLLEDDMAGNVGGRVML